MKYELNALDSKTTNNFKVNSLEIEFVCPKIDKFKSFDISSNCSDLVIEEEVVTSKLTSRIGLEFDKYLNLNITVPERIKVKDSILINYYFEDNDHLIDKININYEKDSSCDFIITYKSNSDNYNLHYLVENVISKEGSSGNITLINLMNDVSDNFMSILNDVYSGNITHNIIDIGGKRKVYNVYSNLFWDNSCNYLNNIYLGNKEN